MTLFLDAHDKALELDLRKYVPLQVGAYNPDLPDLWCLTQWGTVRAWSRKQVGEILSGLDAVEEQLARDYSHVDELVLVIEGVIVEIDGKVWTLQKRDLSSDWILQGKKHGKKDWIHGHYLEPYNFSYLGYRKWLASVRQWGIEVVEVPSRETLVTELVAAYQHSQTAPEDHATFRRPLRPKQEMPSSDPMLLNLMSLHDKKGRTFLGVKTAETLRDGGFGTLQALAGATVEELAALNGLGKVSAGKILKSLGRE